MEIDSIEELKSDNNLIIKNLYYRFRQEFLGFGKRYGLDENELCDIYQEAFLALRNKAIQGRLVAVKSSMKTYLFGIGKYKIFDRLRELKREKPLENPLHAVDDSYPEILPEEEEVLTPRQELLREFFGQMGARCQELLTLFYYRGLSIKEIITAGGYRNANVVKAQKSRCLKSLREMMTQKSHG